MAATTQFTFNPMLAFPNEIQMHDKGALLSDILYLLKEELFFILNTLKTKVPKSKSCCIKTA